MVRYYVTRIRDGKLTLDEVPPRWRAQVTEYLAAEQKY